jgi:hypothetical protein
VQQFVVASKNANIDEGEQIVARQDSMTTILELSRAPARIPPGIRPSYSGNRLATINSSTRKSTSERDGDSYRAVNSLRDRRITGADVV